MLRIILLFFIFALKRTVGDRRVDNGSGSKIMLIDQYLVHRHLKRRLTASLGVGPGVLS